MTDAGCTWCGKTPTSREHLVPRWLSDVLIEASPAADGYDFAYTFTTAEGEGPLRTYPQKEPELVVRAVCRECNQGWMERLEGQVRPFLTPMVRGDHIHLKQRDQVTLAHWVAKVAVLFEHYARDAVVLGPNDVRQIYEETHAPTGWHMRLAYRADDNPAPFDFYLARLRAEPAGSSTREAMEQEDANAFCMTLGLGRLVIMVVGGPGIDNPDRWRLESQFPMTIWPPNVGGLSWPPQNPVLRDREELRRFHESFWVGILNPEFPRPDALGRVLSAHDEGPSHQADDR